MTRVGCSWLLVAGVLALLAAACGDSDAPEGATTPPPPATASATSTSTAEPTQTAAPSPLTPPATPGGPVAVATEEGRCRDPYPDGAPYRPSRGEPIRLVPLGTPPALAPYQAPPLITDQELAGAVLRMLRGEAKHFAVVIKNLSTNRGIALDPGRPFYAASLFKTWVMLEAYHQRHEFLLDFADEYIASPYYERTYRLNDGELAACDRVTVRQALSKMIAVSDNVAANMLLDRVGAGNVNNALRGLGLTGSGLQQDSLLTTAGDMALLLEGLARGAAVSEGTSEEMVALLLTQGVRDRLPALLPPDTPVAHKTGNWRNATHDAGIVFSPKATYVIVVLTDYGFGDDGASLIARLSRAVYDFYNRG